MSVLARDRASTQFMNPGISGLVVLAAKYIAHHTKQVMLVARYKPKAVAVIAHESGTTSDASSTLQHLINFRPFQRSQSTQRGLLRSVATWETIPRSMRAIELRLLVRCAQNRRDWWGAWISQEIQWWRLSVGKPSTSWCSFNLVSDISGTH